MVRPMRSDRCVSCLSVLSVTLVYCGQTVRWTKMKLGTVVGLGPGHIVLDRDPAPHLKGAQHPNFLPMCIVAKRLDGSRCHLVRRYVSAQATALNGDPAPPKGAQLPNFRSMSNCLLWPNGWMHQNTTRYGGRPQPRWHCARWVPSSHLKGAQPPIFGPCLLWPNGCLSELLLSSAVVLTFAHHERTYQ